MTKIQKYTVLFALFFVPLLFYIFLQLGTHNFGKLNVVSKDVLDISLVEKSVTFKNKVTVLTFLGNDLTKAEGEVYNLNEKIYKKFYGFTDFQLISLVDKSQKEAIEKIKNKLAINTNLIKWKFVFASSEEIEAIFDGLKTPEKLDANYHSNKAFIVDKENKVRRGKSTINGQKDKQLFGYNMKSVAELKNDMHDDVKVVLAEYSFALKKNRSEDRRKNSISNDKK